MLLVPVSLVAAGCTSDSDDASTTTTEPAAAVGQLTVTASEYAFDLPPTAPVGATRLTLSNTGEEPHHAQVFKLNADATMDDVGAQLATGDPAALLEVGTFAGGTGTVNPGATSAADAVPVLEAGTYAFMCFVEDAEGVPHVAQGMLAPMEVTADPDATTSVETDGDIGLIDFGFRTTADVEGGTYEIVNEGEQPHELNIIRLADGATQDDVLAFFEGEPEGPPNFEPVGGMQALLPGPGGRQALAMDLEAGSYVFICFIPDFSDGVPHFVKGMIQTVEVS